MTITVKEIENATLETIYWWNRDEYYYHMYFSKLDKIYDDKTVLHFFTRKIFEVFLKEYSIRRNLSSGVESVDIFIDELFENEFFRNVIKGETDIIDEISMKLKESGKSTKRNTKSLLSKVAFLINPQKFSLYDSLAKESMWSINKNEKQFKFKELDCYSGFLRQTVLLRKSMSENNLFQHSKDALSEFTDTEAFGFFSKNNEAFEMRIVDKYLWLYAQNKDNRFENKGYKEMIKLVL